MGRAYILGGKATSLDKPREHGMHATCGGVHSMNIANCSAAGHERSTARHMSITEVEP